MITADSNHRFWSNVAIRHVDECWEWTAGVMNNRYGVFWIDRNLKQKTAHRLVYELCNGPINDLHVLHKCDNRLCVNPSHLFLGTNLDNIKDMITKGRQAKGAQKKTLAKLSDSDIKKIRKDIRSQSKIAKEFGIDQSLVSRIKSNKRWRHVM